MCHAWAALRKCLPGTDISVPQQHLGYDDAPLQRHRDQDVLGRALDIVWDRLAKAQPTTPEHSAIPTYGPPMEHDDGLAQDHPPRPTTRLTPICPTHGGPTAGTVAGTYPTMPTDRPLGRQAATPGPSIKRTEGKPRTTNDKDEAKQTPPAIPENTTVADTTRLANPGPNAEKFDGQNQASLIWAMPGTRRWH